MLLFCIIFETTEVILILNRFRLIYVEVYKEKEYTGITSLAWSD